MNSRVCAIGLILVVLSLFASSLQAAPWTLAGCDPAGEPGWREFERNMRTAAPGSPVYVPVPFPATTDEVVKDYLYQYWSVVKKMSPQLYQPHETRLMRDLSSAKASFRVLRAENWSPLRCRSDQRRDFYNLVRVFETSGIEISRAVLTDAGLLVTWNNMPAAVPGQVPNLSRTLPPAPAAMAELNSKHGLEGRDPEYLIAGGTILCHLTHPCLAFRQRGLSYITTGEQLFEVSAAGPKLILGKEVGSPAEDALLQRLAPEERLISLGGKTFTIGRLVDPASIRARSSAAEP